MSDPNIIGRVLHRLTGTTSQRFFDPGISNSRVACAAAIVVGCILAYGVLVVAGFFSN